MRDSFGRTIDYLRISITGRCNHRCLYCMPKDARCAQEKSPLSPAEIEEIARAAASLGVRKLRVTGGEPLLRRDAVEICRRLGRLEGVEDLSLTTNGALLAPLAGELKAAGIRRINISLDTLDREKFQKMTGGSLDSCLAGIEAALAWGMSPVKLNVVLIGGFNDGEIPALAALSSRWGVEVRFIELMPMGGGAQLFPPSAYCSAERVLEQLPDLIPCGMEGVARLYRRPGRPGRIGLISPMSSHFCGTCSRLRLTADGFLRPCLHSSLEIPLRGLHGQALQEAILEAVRQKPPVHPPLSASSPSPSSRGMNQIGG